MNLLVEHMWTARLVASQRITPVDSPEEVRRLQFASTDAGFAAQAGHCLRVLVPGQFGQRWHERLYSVAETDQADPLHTGFTLLVRRCDVIDDFNGERYAGVASNHLCNLSVGDEIRFTGPLGYPFPIPADRAAGLLMIGMGTGIAPFRVLVQRLYAEPGGWQGPVRLFYGARSGLEMLYMNEENADLALYYDQPTFRAFRAVSPQPHFDAPPALGRSLVDHAAEVWAMLQDARTHVYVAGPEALLAQIDQAMTQVAGSAARWAALAAQLRGAGRWHDVLY